MLDWTYEMRLHSAPDARCVMLLYSYEFKMQNIRREPRAFIDSQ